VERHPEVKLDELPPGVQYAKAIVTLLPSLDLGDVSAAMRLSASTFAECNNEVDAVIGFLTSRLTGAERPCDDRLGYRSVRRKHKIGLSLKVFVRHAWRTEYLWTWQLLEQVKS
jgi:hypothetical protein